MPSPRVGDFGSDHALHAAVAFGGLSALASSQAFCLNLDTDPSSGMPLDGRRRWQLFVPPIEVAGLWWLSMHVGTPDGRLLLAANPIGRHSVGDRMPGLQRRADGSNELLMQHEATIGARNRLPAPAQRVAAASMDAAA